MLDIYETLEIKKVLEEISSLARSEIAKEKILSLKMYSDYSLLKKELLLTDEMIQLIYRYSRLNIVSSFSLIKDVELAKRFGVLTPLDFSHILNDIKTSNALVSFFKKINAKEFNNLYEIYSSLEDLSSLEEEMNRVILPDLSISNKASETLFSIRNKIKKIEKEIRETSYKLIDKYSDYLSEKNLTFRNDHFVLPVKTTLKNKISGIIHDVSDSGMTTFIEPTELVELSNELYSYKALEREEIRRILKELTEKVALKGDEILKNNEIIARLDYLDAKASYAIKKKGYIAALEDEGIIELKNARHPLIEESRVISNDFFLNKDERIIVISGPNAGGKTVALKTLGINIMLNQMGMATLSSEKARLSFFPRIYADIGDNQSLSDNLSTFAAHISNLSTITHFAKRNDLILLDELGTGTSPKEGEAIALAITDYLVSLKAFALISSHYEKMKEYAFRKDAVRNAMMVFDEKRLEPTYKLKIGYPGRSYGLVMAKRYHLKESVLDRASFYLNKDKDRSINDVIDKLNKLVRDNETMNESLKKERKDLEIKEKEYKYNAKVLQKKKDDLVNEANSIKDEMLKKAEEEITNILRIKSNPNVSQKELIKARDSLRKLNEEEIEDNSFIEDIKLNDYVELKDLDLIGKVISIKGNKISVITLDGMRVNTTLDKLSLTEEPIVRNHKSVNADELIKDKMNVKMELNIIGEHVDDGIRLVSKYLDDARIKHFSSVRIIHGMGSGALRKAVWEYLAKCDFIKEYHYGGTFDGGSGATIVIFK